VGIALRKIAIFFILTIILFQDTILVYFDSTLINSFDELFILSYLIISLSYSFKKGQITKASLFVMSFILSFLLIGWISGISNADLTYYKFLMGGFLMVKIFLLIFSVINMPPSKQLINDIIKSIKLLTILVVCVGMINLLLPNLYTNIFEFGFIDKRLGLPSVMSIFIHPGVFGWFMLFGALYNFSKFSVQKDKKFIYLFILFSALALLSFKVKVIMGLAACLVFYYFFLVRRLRLKYLVTAVTILGGLFLIFGRLISSTILMYFTNEGPTTARYALTSTSFTILKDYFPLGVGFGNYGSWFARIEYSDFYYLYGISNVYGMNPREGAFFATDTFWPSVLAETGFLGTIAFVFILFFLFRRILSNYRLTKNYIYLFALLVLLQTIIESMGEPIFNSSPQNILIALVVGLAITKRGKVEEGVP
jgi:hypothetical protein